MISRTALWIVILSPFPLASTAKPEWSWQRPWPTGPDIDGIFFVDENTGWFCSGSNADFGEIFVTAHGGESRDIAVQFSGNHICSVEFITGGCGKVTGTSGSIIDTEGN